MDPLTWLRTTVKNAEEHGANVASVPGGGIGVRAPQEAP